MRFKKFRFLLLPFVLAIYLISNYYPCLILKISNLPERIIREKEKQTGIILFLYGNICANCPSGSFLYSLRGEKNIMFVVPSDFSSNDIENLRRTFSLKGQIIKGGDETGHLLQKFAKCFRLDDWKRNFIVEINNNKKITSVKKF